MSVTFDVNVTNYSNMVNDAGVFGSGFTSGIATQGDEIGTAVGVGLTVGVYIGLIALVFGIILFLYTQVGRLKQGAGKAMHGYH